MSDPSVAAQIPLAEPALGGNEIDYMVDAVSSGWLSAGPYVRRFEDAVAAATGSRNAVACASGTAALHVALLLAGVRRADLVVCPTLTFIATSNAITYCGADPVFLGCDDSLCLDPDALAGFLEDGCETTDVGLVELSTGRRVAAVVPVHVLGTPCSPRVFDVAASFGLRVVEDAAEAIGSRWVGESLGGREVGTAGLLGVLSFNGNKLITSGGGGMILTADDDLAKRARYLVDQAKDDALRYIHGEVGFNYRLANPLAALGLAQVEQLDRLVAARLINFDRYRERLHGGRGIRLLEPPPEVRSNHWFYPLVVDPQEAGIDRETLMTRLRELGIQTRPLWYPNHRLKPYLGSLSFNVDRAVWYWERVLCLPCGAALSAEEIERVCEEIAKALPAVSA